MVTIHECRNADDLIDYHRADLNGACRQAELCPFWFGKGARLLGLDAVTAPPFRRLCDHQHPKTGKRLTQRTATNRRIASDHVYSPPKSVSVLSGLVGDKRIDNAHLTAVKAALGVAESLAQARVRKSGADTNRFSRNIVAVGFNHFTSRENDPQLHTHTIVFNATFDAGEEIWKALQAVEPTVNKAC